MLIREFNLHALVRKGPSPFPNSLRYGSLLFFSFAGAYAGFMSAGKMYAQRILSVPNSRLADDLRIVIGDWQSRNGPIATEQDTALPDEPLPDAAVGTGRGKNEIIPRNPTDVRREQRMNQTPGTQRRWSDQLGLTNKTDRD